MRAAFAALSVLPTAAPVIAFRGTEATSGPIARALTKEGFEEALTFLCALGLVERGVGYVKTHRQVQLCAREELVTKKPKPPPEAEVTRLLAQSLGARCDCNAVERWGEMRELVPCIEEICRANVLASQDYIPLHFTSSTYYLHVVVDLNKAHNHATKMLEVVKATCRDTCEAVSNRP